MGLECWGVGAPGYWIDEDAEGGSAESGIAGGRVWARGGAASWNAGVGVLQVGVLWVGVLKWEC